MVWERSVKYIVRVVIQHNDHVYVHNYLWKLVRSACNRFCPLARSTADLDHRWSTTEAAKPTFSPFLYVHETSMPIFSAGL